MGAPIFQLLWSPNAQASRARPANSPGRGGRRRRRAWALQGCRAGRSVSRQCGGPSAAYWPRPRLCDDSSDALTQLKNSSYYQGCRAAGTCTSESLSLAPYWLSPCTTVLVEPLCRPHPARLRFRAGLVKRVIRVILMLARNLWRIRYHALRKFKSYYETAKTGNVVSDLLCY